MCKYSYLYYICIFSFIYIHMCAHICKHIHLHTHAALPHVYVSFCLCTYLPIYLSISLSNDRPTYKTSCVTYKLTDCLSIYLDHPCTSVLFFACVSEPAGGRASINLLLRGWKVDVFRQAFALPSAHCSVLEGLNVVCLVSICRCNDGRFYVF